MGCPLSPRAVGSIVAIAFRLPPLSCSLHIAAHTSPFGLVSAVVCTLMHRDTTPLRVSECHRAWAASSGRRGRAALSGSACFVQSLSLSEQLGRPRGMWSGLFRATLSLSEQLGRPCVACFVQLLLLSEQFGQPPCSPVDHIVAPRPSGLVDAIVCRHRKAPSSGLMPHRVFKTPPS